MECNGSNPSSLVATYLLALDVNPDHFGAARGVEGGLLVGAMVYNVQVSSSRLVALSFPPFFDPPVPLPLRRDALGSDVLPNSAGSALLGETEDCVRSPSPSHSVVENVGDGLRYIGCRDALAEPRTLHLGGRVRPYLEVVRAHEELR